MSSPHGPPATEAWDLWTDTARAPGLNMAVDEALLLTAPQRGRPLLRLYAWDRPAVTIGYVQKHAAAPPTGFAVVRRLTGGGVVYHDHDFTYSVVLPPDHWLAGLDRLRSYDWINRAVLAGLERCRLGGTLATQELGRHVDRGTMVCFKHPTRYDILLGNRKVAGSAQRRLRTGILHQGSLHFGGPLPLPRPELSRRIVAGFVAELHCSFVPFTPSADLLKQAERLVEERYGTEAWNRRR